MLHELGTETRYASVAPRVGFCAEPGPQRRGRTLCIFRDSFRFRSRAVFFT